MSLVGFSRAIRVFTDSYRYIRSSDSGAPVAQQKLEWAKHMLQLIQVEYTVVGEPMMNGPAIFVGNHISYIDIALLLATVPGLSFVAKQEIASWPVFGAGAKKIDTVFVKRESASARFSAYGSIRTALEKRAARVAIFPSGTTLLDESKPWKFGSFRLAESLSVPLQAFRLSYEPLRRAAYIDDDFFPAHLLRLCSGGPVKAKIEFAPAGRVHNAAADCARWQAWAAGRR